MLKENGAPPADGRWADIAVLEPVRDYKARHASTLLTFDAVVDAIEPDRGQAACIIPEKACPGLGPGWEPVFGRDHAQTNRLMRLLMGWRQRPIAPAIL